MTLATDGVRVYEYNNLLTGDVECYAHEGDLFVLYSREKNGHIPIDPIGMSENEIRRAMRLANAMLARAPLAPVNRRQRRAMKVHH